MGNDLKLGKCCICEQENESVRNVITLHKEIPAEEKNGGWGCFVCDRPARGAVAVLCDDCLDKNIGDEQIEIKFACLGYPGENRRIEIEKLTIDFDHDMSKHPEENQMNFISNENDFDDDDFDDCGMTADGSCTKAGSEECDWECPYSK